VGLTNLGSELETCVGSRVSLVGVFISFEKDFYRLPFTPPSLVRCIGPSPSPDFPKPPRPQPPAAAEPRHRPPLRLHSGPLPLLGERVVQPGNLPGRQRRQLAGAGRARAARPGQGPNCFDFNSSRVFRVEI
jgi:hypothetical protein